MRFLKLDYNYTDKSFIKEYYNYINRHRAKYISKDLIKILQKMYKYKLYKIIHLKVMLLAEKYWSQSIGTYLGAVCNWRVKLLIIIIITNYYKLLQIIPAIPNSLLIKDLSTSIQLRTINTLH